MSNVKLSYGHRYGQSAQTSDLFRPCPEQIRRGREADVGRYGEGGTPSVSSFAVAPPPCSPDGRETPLPLRKSNFSEDLAIGCLGRWQKGGGIGGVLDCTS